VAVNDVSFDVSAALYRVADRAERRGKTTLFNMLTGCTGRPQGRILLGERDITRARPDVITSYGVARTFQNIRLFGAMTAVENVMIGHHTQMRAGLFGSILRPPGSAARNSARASGRASCWRTSAARARVRPARLAAAVRRQRRVEIARALASTGLLLLDEPTAGMNPQESQALRVHAGDARRT